MAQMIAGCRLAGYCKGRGSWSARVLALSLPHRIEGLYVPGSHRDGSRFLIRRLAGPWSLQHATTN